MNMPTHMIGLSVFVAAFLGLLTGAALARSNMCMLGAAHGLSKGEFRAFYCVLIASAAGAVVFFLTGRAGLHAPAPWTWPSLLTVVGAVLFAIGARLNLACSVGTVGRLSSGDLGALSTILGLLAALAVFPRTMVHDDRPPWAGTLEIPWVAGMIVVLLTIVVIASRRGALRDLAAPMLLGALAALLYSLHSQVTWLELATEAFKGAGSWTIAIAGFLSLLVGAFAARHFAGEIKWRLPDWRRFWREFLGGALMGTGSLLIPGASDALAFYGVPSGSPHALVAFIVLFGTIVLSFWLFPVNESAAERIPTKDTAKA